MKLIDKLAALFGCKQRPVRDGYFVTGAPTPANHLRGMADSYDFKARTSESAARAHSQDAETARKIAISHRNMAAEYRAAADALDCGLKSEAA